MLALSDALGAMPPPCVLAMWTWSLTAGVAFSWDFISLHAIWFVAVPIWVTALSPTRHAAKGHWTRARPSPVCSMPLAPCLWRTSPRISTSGPMCCLEADGQEDISLLECGLADVWRTLLLLWTLTRATFMRRMLVVGDGTEAAAVLALAREPGLEGCQVLAPAQSAEGEALNVTESIEEMALRLGATEVVLAVRGPVPDQTLDQLLKCQEAGIDVVTFARVTSRRCSGSPVRHLGHRWLYLQLFSGAGPHDLRRWPNA